MSARQATPLLLELTTAVDGDHAVTEPKVRAASAAVYRPTPEARRAGTAAEDGGTRLPLALELTTAIEWKLLPEYSVTEAELGRYYDPVAQATVVGDDAPPEILDGGSTCQAGTLTIGGDQVGDNVTDD